MIFIYLWVRVLRSSELDLSDDLFVEPLPPVESNTKRATPSEMITIKIGCSLRVLTIVLTVAIASCINPYYSFFYNKSKW
ncbi:MAG: hypothetical protein C4584_00260 [Armatimonadetes bacterium]|nr:MAG: hypothetical protein C4584_00260 [Armatimonadota bacterium]